ncbi:homeobox expressed in ES cells 1-like [Oculina patagonica]
MVSGGNKRKLDEQERGDIMRQRRRRTAFTEEQLDRLEESFMEEKFPGIIIREQLAEELKIKEDRIQVWF